MGFRKHARGIVLTATFALGSVGLAYLPPSMLAQGITTGSLNGTVVDAQGAAIPNASVQAAEQSTGSKVQAQTNGQGSFSFRSVPNGTYTLTINSAGFNELKVEKVLVAAGQVADVGQQKLTIGASTTVQVSAANVDLLQTEQSQVSTSFSALQTEDLPLNGALDNIAQLLPGVAQAHDATFSNSNGNNLSINGQRSRSNNYEIDGQSNNDNSVAGPQIFFANQDAVKEIQVITSNYSAQYGRNMGGVINYITKNGTNAFHGSGFEFYTGSFLSALANGNKNPVLGFCSPGSSGCNIPLPRYVDNRYGGTFGGPILKDKLWFFGATNWEKQRTGTTASVSPTLTPDPTGLQQLTAAFPGNPAVAALTNSGPYGVLAGAVPTGTPKIETVTGPGGATAAVEFAQVKRSISSLFNDQQHVGRIDWAPEDRDHFFLRYLYQDDNTTGQGTIYNGYFYSVPDTTHSIGADWAHTFSSNWVNQLRYSFQQSKLFFQGGTQPKCASTSLSVCNASVTIFGFTGFGYPTNIPQGRTVKVTQAQDNVSWVHGNHSIAFGGDFTYQNSPNVFLPDYNGGYTFGSFDNFLQGTGTLALGDGSPVIPFTEPDFSFYVQDDYHVLPTLTLNLGFRYEFFDQAVNKLHSESVARETGPHPFWDPTLPLAARTYPYTNRNWKNLQPRLGFAYNPANARNLVIRGGYGIQYDPSFYNIFLNSATAAPVINLGSITCDGVAVNCLPANGVQGAAVRALNLSRIPTGVNPNKRSLTNNPANFNNPRAQTYSLGLQYNFRNTGVVGVTYVGNHVSRQFQSLNSNPYLLPVATAFPSYYSPSALCNDPGAFDNGRLHCGQGNVVTRENTAFSNYNSLQVQLQTRAYKGLTIQASYTYSRAIDNADEIYGATSQSNSVTSSQFAQDPLNTDLGERGVANYSYPNLVSIGLVYDVPLFQHDSSFKGKLLGGFEVTTDYGFSNGQPWTAYQFYQASITDPTDGTAANPNSINTTSYCDPKFAAARVGFDTCRPVLANPGAPVTAVGIYVVDPANAFTTAGTGYYNYSSFDANGNLNAPISKNQAHWLYNNKAYANLVGNPYPGAPRAITRGQSYNNLDAAIVKSTAITEGISLKLYLNAFNVLNHQFLGNPDSNIDDGAPFGTNIYGQGNYANGTNPASRFVQLGGKITF